MLRLSPSSLNLTRQRRMRLAEATLLVFASLAIAEAQSFVTERQAMVRNYVAAEGVHNRRVLEALRTVPRHEFVPAHLRKQAYADAALPIGSRQTISPPFIVAYMTETLDPQPDDRVLEIGTGSGYQAAVLGELVKDVYTIEIVPELGKAATERLEQLGYHNVRTRIGDGYAGWPEHAPFDKIIVTCSPEDVPQPLVEQLKEGGRMIVPLGERYQQVFHLFEKREGQLVATRLIPTLFVPMTGTSEQLRDVQPDASSPEILNGNFERDENGDNHPDHWHYRRQAALRTLSAFEGQRYMFFENFVPGRPSQILQGMACDGRKVQRLRLELWVQTSRVRSGPERYQQPSLMLHFYDGNRRPLSDAVVGPWTGTHGWKRITETVEVPLAAREMIVRVGLNGGTGKLGVDDLVLSSMSR